MKKDWKKKIDDLENAQNLERQKKEAEQKQNQEEKEQRVRNLKINELGRKFKCHICIKPAQHPEYIEGSANVDGSMGDGWYNWNLPGDLWQCSKCDQWTCKDHIYKDICQKCAEKM